MTCCANVPLAAKPTKITPAFLVRNVVFEVGCNGLRLKEEILRQPEAAKLFLREVLTLVKAGVAPPDWRMIVQAEYPQLVELSQFVTTLTASV
jgi:hypothetical protein